METSIKPVDISNKIAKMSAHEYISIPISNIDLSFKGEDVEFILNTLTKVHASLLLTMKDTAISAEERKDAYHFAHRTEMMYADIFSQLKLYRPERVDLN